MTFGLPRWIKSRHQDLTYEVPVWYPSHDHPDAREWLVTNGLGGYSSSTVSGAHTRRYHGALVAALNPPTDRHVVLSKIDEVVTVGGATLDLGTNYWASGVVAPTGYRLIESFTILPAPTWVYNLKSGYLIKQHVLLAGTNELYLTYTWLPDPDHPEVDARLNVRFFLGFRGFHREVRGSSGSFLSQAQSDQSLEINLNGTAHSLFLNWSSGAYVQQEQWWWGYHWPEESARELADEEDLLLAGMLSASLSPGVDLRLAVVLDGQADAAKAEQAVDSNLKRQRLLLARAGLPASREGNLLALACDQFVLGRGPQGEGGMSICAGYPWLGPRARDALIALPGLTVATRRYDEAQSILSTYAARFVHGLARDFSGDGLLEHDSQSADSVLWFCWALYHYYRASKNVDFLREQFPLLLQAARAFVDGTEYGVAVDLVDGLLKCGNARLEMTWMNARVADIPITPRAGKPVEICALWLNYLQSLLFFAEELAEDASEWKGLADKAHRSMQKFWNNERQCLFDVIEPSARPADKPIDPIRPNQIIAVALPFRAFTQLQEKAVLTAIDAELLTPLGLRSLTPTDPSYQGTYGCGFSHADQYHRDLSYHQGTVFPWLMGFYCEALLNVHGPLPETFAKIRILLQPLLNHLVQEACIGSISEIFDGNTPYTPRGCFAQAAAVAEAMRVLAMVSRR